MKKVFWVVGIIFLAGCAGTASENMLVNSSFDDGRLVADPWDEQAWYIAGAGKLSEKEARTGSICAKLYDDGSPSSYYWYAANQIVDLGEGAGTDGAEYTLEGHAKYTGVFHGNACVKMDFRDKERNSVGGKHPISCFLTPDDPEDTWKYGKITAKVPAGKEHQDVRYVVVSAGMHIDGDRKGVVYFDDLILRKTCGILVRQNE